MMANGSARIQVVNEVIAVVMAEIIEVMPERIALIPVVSPSNINTGIPKPLKPNNNFINISFLVSSLFS